MLKEITEIERKKALAKFLELDGTQDIEFIDDFKFSVDGIDEYLVVTDEEADRLTGDYIRDTLWAFNADFIIDHSKLPYETREMILAYQKEKCESANETIKALIDDMSEFIDDAIASDGRGHFIAQYDGNENEEGDFYIYRTN